MDALNPIWLCPRCNTMNYQRGACGCCGFNGREFNKIDYTFNPKRQERPSTTDGRNIKVISSTK